MDRTERQKEVLRKWIRANLRGTVEAATGFGKSRLTLMGISLLRQKYPNLKTIIIVPTELLKEQWQLHLNSWQIPADVYIVNSAIKQELHCDLLVIDEVHRMAASTYSNIFKTCKYKYILCLTATLERLDGKHLIIEEYCPICDKISTSEAISNGWLASSTEYKVVLKVSDIDRYKQIDKDFQEHFEFFGRNFQIAMSMIGPNGFKSRLNYRNILMKMNPNQDPKLLYQQITFHATSLMRTLQLRKKFINDHPKKIELAKEIIRMRPFSKIITFSATIDIAAEIGIGDVYSGKTSKKESKKVLENFSRQQSGVLNTVRKANEGADIPGLNCAIILGQDSSKTTFIQRLGRCIRKEGDKQAEIFTFVIENTIEEAWFDKSHENQTFIPVDEENLRLVLQGRAYKQYLKPSNKFLFRF